MGLRYDNNTYLSPSSIAQIAQNAADIATNAADIATINGRYLWINGDQIRKGSAGTSIGLNYVEAYDSLYQASGTDVYRYGRWIATGGRWHAFFGHNIFAKSSNPTGSLSGDYNVALGRSLGRDFTGTATYNALIGANVAASATFLSRSFLMGIDTARGSSEDAVVMGVGARYNSAGETYRSIILGQNAAYSAAIVTGSVVIGNNAAQNSGDLTSCIYIGSSARPSSSSARDNEIVIGQNQIGQGSNTFILGNGNTVNGYLNCSNLILPRVSATADTTSTITHTAPITLNGVTYKIMLTT